MENNSRSENNSRFSPSRVPPSTPPSATLDRARPGRGPQLRPVDAPGAAHADPDQGAASLGRRRQRQMVEVVDAGVETAGMRRLQEAETLPIEVMTELVQQRVKEATIRRHLPEHRGAHPDPDPLLLEVVVAEQLEVSALPDLPRPGPQHPQSGRGDCVGPSEQAKNRGALDPDAPWVAGGEGLLQKECAVLELMGVGERRQAGERVAPLEFATRLGASWRSVRDHATNLTGLMRQHLDELANHALPALSRALESGRIGRQEPRVLEREPRATGRRRRERPGDGPAARTPGRSARNSEDACADRSPAPRSARSRPTMA